MISKSRIEICAEKIIQTRCIAEPEDIDLEAIALTLGATIKERPLVGCEARIVGQNNKAIITVNQEGSYERKRFSLGHELGHWQLHRGINFACMQDDIGNPSGKSKRKEREADEFSANLLMPGFLFKPIAKSFAHANFKAISELSNRFKTSFISTAIRFVDSNVIPAIIVCHDQTKRQWFKRSNDIPERWFPQGKVDEESSAFDILYGRGGKDTQQQKVSATAWFDCNEAADYEVLEQSLPYGVGKVLTLLEIFENDMLEEDQVRTKKIDDFRW